MNHFHHHLVKRVEEEKKRKKQKKGERIGLDRLIRKKRKWRLMMMKCCDDSWVTNEVYLIFLFHLIRLYQRRKGEDEVGLMMRMRRKWTSRLIGGWDLLDRLKVGWKEMRMKMMVERECRRATLRYSRYLLLRC